MTDRKLFDTLVGPEESQRLFGALRARRDASGHAQDAGGRRHAGDARRQPRDNGDVGACADAASAAASCASPVRRPRPPTRSIPRSSRTRPTTRAAACSTTVSPSLDGSLTPQPALAGIFHHQGRQDLGVHAAQRRDLPRRQAADAGRRRVLSIIAPQGPGDRVEGQGAGRSDRQREGNRPERGHFRAHVAQRRPAGDSRHVPLPHRRRKARPTSPPASGRARTS